MNLKIKETSKNYVCTVVQIQTLFDIEGADRLKRTTIYGNNVVVSTDVKVSDIMLYFVSGTKLNNEFCSFNNLLTDSEMNKDKKKGYISHKQFRVKAIKLKGVISDGILLPLNSLSVWLSDAEIKSLKLGDEFTDINGHSLCQKYIVEVKGGGQSNPKTKSNTPKLSRLIDKQFQLHNDTDNLRKNIHKLNLNDIISLHYKKHGTSVVVGNVLVKKPLKLYEKVLQYLGVNVIDTEYDIVYSSRKVVKNQYLNPNVTDGYYGEYIWGVVAKRVSNLIPKGWTLYGEIIGFTAGGSYIQKGFDYGCNSGEHKFYVYKISVTNQDGSVIYLTDKQIEEWCEKVGLLYKDTFIYYGFVDGIFESKDFTDWDILHRTEERDNWRETLLDYLEYKYNEKDCYMCVNKVPEEGIILRVERLESYEAYKLKSKRFIFMESEAQETDEVNLEDNQ
jgi:hypothetical protein